MRRAAIVWLAAMACMVPAALGAGSKFAIPIYEDRHVADTEGRAIIGAGYACAVVSKPRPGVRRRLLIFVTSDRAERRAIRVRADLEHARRTKVKRVGRRWRASTMEKVRERVESGMPEDGVSGLGLESPLGRRSCPRVEILLPPVGESTDAAEAWAQAARDRFGADRVIVNRATARPL